LILNPDALLVPYPVSNDNIEYVDILLLLFNEDCNNKEEGDDASIVA
jgi:hypothetical protein